MQNASPKHGRFRFSLRTLFVALTVCCVGLGFIAWGTRIVRHRREMYAAIVSSDGEVSEFFHGVPGPDSRRVRDGDAAKLSNLVRELLGDRHVYQIAFPRELSSVDWLA